MKKILLLISFGMSFSTQALAYTWTHYVDDPDPYFYDKSSIKKTSAGVYTVFTLKHDTHYPTSRVYTFTFDCANKKYSVGPSIFYSAHKGTGKVLENDSWTSSMKDLSEGDPHKTVLFEIICKSG